MKTVRDTIPPTRIPYLLAVLDVLSTRVMATLVNTITLVVSYV